jgi:hypothetical protein
MNRIDVTLDGPDRFSVWVSMGDWDAGDGLERVWPDRRYNLGSPFVVNTALPDNWFLR